MAITLTRISPGAGKATEVVTIVGTGMAASDKVWIKRPSDETYVAVEAGDVVYKSATTTELTLDAADFDEYGAWDIGMSASGGTEPEDTLPSGLFFLQGTVGNPAFGPDNVIKGAVEELYIDGRFMGHTHGAFELEHSVDTSDIEVDQSLQPIRTIKVGEKYSLAVPLAEVTLENIKDVWGVSSTITTDGDYRTLTFGGDETLPEKNVVAILPAGNEKKFILTLYRCQVIASGTLSWSRDDQVDLPIQLQVLADTSRPANDQTGKFQEYTPA